MKLVLVLFLTSVKLGGSVAVQAFSNVRNYKVHKPPGAKAVAVKPFPKAEDLTKKSQGFTSFFRSAGPPVPRGDRLYGYYDVDFFNEELDVEFNGDRPLEQQHSMVLFVQQNPDGHIDRDYKVVAELIQRCLDEDQPFFRNKVSFDFTKDKQPYSFVHFAATKCSKEVVDYALSHRKGSDLKNVLSRPTKFGWTLVHYVSKNSNVASVRYIFEFLVVNDQEQLIYQLTKDKRSVAHIAAMHSESTETIQYIFEFLSEHGRKDLIFQPPLSTLNFNQCVVHGVSSRCNLEEVKYVFEFVLEHWGKDPFYEKAIATAGYVGFQDGTVAHTVVWGSHHGEDSMKRLQVVNYVFEFLVRHEMEDLIYQITSDKRSIVVRKKDAVVSPGYLDCTQTIAHIAAASENLEVLTHVFEFLVKHEREELIYYTDQSGWTVAVAAADQMTNAPETKNDTELQKYSRFFLEPTKYVFECLAQRGKWDLIDESYKAILDNAKVFLHGLEEDYVLTQLFVPYISDFLVKHGKEDLLALQDAVGWTMFHYAVMHYQGEGRVRQSHKIEKIKLCCGNQNL